MSEKFDLVAIGTGSGASAVAHRCRSAGWKVAIVDSRPFSGTCALRGCDPGIRAGEARIEWPQLMRFKRCFIDGSRRTGRRASLVRASRPSMAAPALASPCALRAPMLKARFRPTWLCFVPADRRGVFRIQGLRLERRCRAVGHEADNARVTHRGARAQEEEGSRLMPSRASGAQRATTMLALFRDANRQSGLGRASS